ncbi:MAG TPA: hypothetical protein PK668_06125 [Myxococcota bacterium]|nr:hypothetical protein [Myxococcota bacterium]HRY92581.1 hypothetical protein [Myxococcota bacterium]HSA23237.1 hypothetical protein [Myxococcota bacterium]
MPECSGSPSVVIDSGAQENGLANMLADLMRQNMEAHPAKARAFRRLRASVAITAPDAEVSLTMNFNRGACVIFDGVVGQPALHIQADSETILKLSNLPLRLGLPDPLAPESKALVQDLLARRVVIKGLALHPLTLVLLTQVISVV